jgi:hypothetical protein
MMWKLILNTIAIACGCGVCCGLGYRWGKMDTRHGHADETADDA